MKSRLRIEKVRDVICAVMNRRQSLVVSRRAVSDWNDDIFFATTADEFDAAIFGRNGYNFNHVDEIFYLLKIGGQDIFRRLSTVEFFADERSFEMCAQNFGTVRKIFSIANPIECTINFFERHCHRRRQKTCDAGRRQEVG